MEARGGILSTYYKVETASSEKAIFCVIPITWHSGKEKTRDAVKEKEKTVKMISRS